MMQPYGWKPQRLQHSRNEMNQANAVCPTSINNSFSSVIEQSHSRKSVLKQELPSSPSGTLSKFRVLYKSALCKFTVIINTKY